MSLIHASPAGIRLGLTVKYSEGNVTSAEWYLCLLPATYTTLWRK